MTSPPRAVAPSPLWSTPPAAAPARPPATKADGKTDFRSAVRQQAHKLGQGHAPAAATGAVLPGPLADSLGTWLGETSPRADLPRDPAEAPSRDSDSGHADAEHQGDPPPRQGHAVTPEVDAAPGHDTLADHTAAALADQLTASQGMGCFAVQLPGACRVDVIYDLTPERARLYLRTSTGGTQQPGLLDPEALARRIGAQCGRTVEVLCV
ncbi:hypothetical protein AACH06_03955 [Ideonella sp. DXS29W]|uniref:Flagellar hook-length control protein FliK n=1 Tax=Ideonella lacteola TaxID=2984193 RepID=A0ABU9BJ24_9BURK